MANIGNLYLNNASVINLYERTKDFQDVIQDALYEQFQAAFKISVSNFFRGNFADSFKNYMQHGTINAITEMLDISSDMTMMIQLSAEVFYQYENNHSGQVDEKVLDYINSVLNTKENIFNEMKTELNGALQLASNYISTKDLGITNVNNGYTNTRKKVKKIREDLYEIDSTVLQSMNKLNTRIHELQNFINNLIKYCDFNSNVIHTGNWDTVQRQEWYKKAGNVALNLKLAEDPFAYAAGEVSLSENQWAAGLCSDVYAYAGYSLYNASGEIGMEDGTYFAKGTAALLKANGYAQFTDYLKAQANVKAYYAEADAKYGISDDYVGCSIGGEVGVLDADASVTIGSDNLNAYVKGEVKVLSADGKVAMEFEDDGEFAIGIDASATVAEAGIKGGTTIFSYKDKDLATGESERLLGFNASVDASAGGAFAIWAESKTAFETKYVNINATTVKISAAALLGIDLSITVPTTYFKWPW